MKIKPPATALLGLILSSCFSSGTIHGAKIDDTLNRYGGAIRWGEFERAQEFQVPSKRTRLDLDWLRTIHVSSYEVIYKKEDLGGNIREQTAKIRYFIEGTGLEKTLLDRQLWRYDEDVGNLMLETDLPVFQ